MVKVEKCCFGELNSIPVFFAKLMCDAVSVQSDSYSTRGVVHYSVWLNSQELNS